MSEVNEKLRVWIDQDECTGDGICSEICPSLFGMHDDGLAYVKEEAWPNILGPNGASADGKPAVRNGLGELTKPDFVQVPEHLAVLAIEAAEECPGECIHFIPPGER